MKIKKLNLKKEIVANLSNAESSQIKGGESGAWICTVGLCTENTCGTCNELSCYASECNGSCPAFCGDLSNSFITDCCGDTYANCSKPCPEF